MQNFEKEPELICILARDKHHHWLTVLDSQFIEVISFARRKALIAVIKKDKICHQAFLSTIWTQQSDISTHVVSLLLPDPLPFSMLSFKSSNLVLRFGVKNGLRILQDSLNWLPWEGELYLEVKNILMEERRLGPKQNVSRFEFLWVFMTQRSFTIFAGLNLLMICKYILSTALDTALDAGRTIDVALILIRLKAAAIKKSDISEVRASYERVCKMRPSINDLLKILAPKRKVEVDGFCTNLIATINRGDLYKMIEADSSEFGMLSQYFSTDDLALELAAEVFTTCSRVSKSHVTLAKWTLESIGALLPGVTKFSWDNVLFQSISNMELIILRPFHNYTPDELALLRALKSQLDRSIRHKNSVGHLRILSNGLRSTTAASPLYRIYPSFPDVLKSRLN